MKTGDENRVMKRRCNRIYVDKLYFENALMLFSLRFLSSLWSPTF